MSDNTQTPAPLTAEERRLLGELAKAAARLMVVAVAAVPRLRAQPDTSERAVIGAVDRLAAKLGLGEPDGHAALLVRLERAEAALAHCSRAAGEALATDPAYHNPGCVDALVSWAQTLQRDAGNLAAENARLRAALESYPDERVKPGARLSLREAQRRRLCRICGEKPGLPLILNFGDEFACETCLRGKDGGK